MSASNRSALIFGVTGQDGSILAHQLVEQGWKVYGGYRRGGHNKLWRLEELGILDKIELININLLEPFLVLNIVSDITPEHVYQLAGDSYVVDSFEQPRSVLENNCISTLNVLEAIRIAAPEARLFFPSSSEVFGSATAGKMMDEGGPFSPLNPYGLSRLAAQKLIDIYRRHHGLHACCGIMFNHEGPLRARSFVTRKITYNLARLRSEGGRPVTLGNLNTRRDWGSAEDYVSIMPTLLDLEVPDDFVFATGTTTTLRRMIEVAADYAGFQPEFDGEGLNEVCVDRKSGQILVDVGLEFFRKSDTPPLVGNPANLKNSTGFKGSRKIEQTIVEMVQADIDRREKGNINV